MVSVLPNQMYSKSQLWQVFIFVSELFLGVNEGLEVLFWNK